MIFDITREDGRSHQQVLIDRVANDPPGTVYTYNDLMEILGFDNINKTRGVVLNAQRRLLKEFSRTMMNVRGVGYRLAEAKDHMMIANGRHRRADIQLQKGLHVLRNVKWDELDTESHKAHMGTLMVMEAMAGSQKAMDKRISSIEEAIKRLA